MGEESSKLASVLATFGHLVFFVFLILGVPIIILLPSGGFELPSVVPLLNRIAASVFYGALAGFGGWCGILITRGLGVVAYRWLRGQPHDASQGGRKRLSPVDLFWWCWGATLSWWAFIHFGKELIGVWHGAA